MALGCIQRFANQRGHAHWSAIILSGGSNKSESGFGEVLGDLLTIGLSLELLDYTCKDMQRLLCT